MAMPLSSPALDLSPALRAHAPPQRLIAVGADAVEVAVMRAMLRRVVERAASSLALRGPQSTLATSTALLAGWKGWTVVQPEQTMLVSLVDYSPG